MIQTYLQDLQEFMTSKLSALGILKLYLKLA